MLKCEGRWAAKIEELLAANYAAQAEENERQASIRVAKARMSGRTVTCANCGAEAVKTGNTQRHCSAKCRLAYAEKRQDAPRRPIGRPRKVRSGQ